MEKQKNSTKTCFIQEALFVGNSHKRSTNVSKIKNATSGITLIALVITIIILLILAGITINLTIRRTWYNKNG